VTPLAHLWQSVQTGKQKSAIHLELIIDVLTGLGVWRPVSTCLNWISGAVARWEQFKDLVLSNVDPLVWSMVLNLLCNNCAATEGAQIGVY